MSERVPSKYTPTECARLYIIDGLSIKEISSLEGAPTPHRLHKWKKTGYGNNGVPWDLARERVPIRTRSGRKKEVIEKIREDAAEVLEQLLERFKEGRGQARFSDYPLLAEFLMKMENIEEEKAKWARAFLREVGKILVRHIRDNRVLAQITLELDALLERVLDELLIDNTLK